jgi:hypothetical protein
MKTACVAAALAWVILAERCWGYDGNKLLNTVPFIMSHDAATGYLDHGVVNGWTKTQSKPFADQLDCGARAFDARPAYREDLGLVWHHGPVYVNHSFEESMEEIKAWAQQNPLELVLIGISSCEGDSCMDRVADVLARQAIPTLSDCSVLATMTLSGAQTMATLDQGGRVLALTGTTGPNGVACSVGHYDPSIDCSGFLQNSSALIAPCLPARPLATLPLAEFLEVMDCAKSTIDPSTLNASTYSCYAWSDTKDHPVSRMFESLDAANAAGPPSDGYLYQMQALWQESDQSVVLGELHLSSLLRDERRSRLNEQLVAAVKAKRWANINFLEVNNVCDVGLELFAALKANY